MKKLLLFSALIFFLPAMASTQGISFGVGVSGGLNIPVVQDDQGSGSTFGFKGIIKAVPFISLEPNVAFSNYGDPELDLEGITNDLDGSKMTSYGIDAVLGKPFGLPGFSPYALVGFGFYKSEREQVGEFEDEDTHFGWTTGLGVSYGFGNNMAFDIRGKFNLIPVDGGSSKKSIFIVGGLNYYFGGN